MGEGREALGQALLEVHTRLRARVATLRSAPDTGPQDVAAFRTSCLAFCRSLRRHHVGEDEGTFEVLRRRRPDLGDALDDLRRDHAFLDPLLDRLEAVNGDGPGDDTTDDGTDDAARVAIERELGGIAAVLENHLAYEERVLVAVLDGLEVEPGSADDEALRAPLRGILEPQEG